MSDELTMGDDRIDFQGPLCGSGGPRVIDQKAGLVRFGNPSDDRPLSDFRAVAVVYSERTVRRTSNRSHAFDPSQNFTQKMVHSLVLVPRQLPPRTAALLDALEGSAPLPPGFSVIVEAHALAEASVLVGIVRPLAARNAAKAIARLAGWPVLELYGEFPVWRPRDRLDLTLQEWRGSIPSIPVPGAVPSGLQVRRDGDTLLLSFAPARPALPPAYLLIAGVVTAMGSIGLVFVDGNAALAVGAIAGVLILAGWTAIRPHGRATHSLNVGPERIQWEGGEGPIEIATQSVEMLRVADSFLVIVTHNDELRCTFPDPSFAEHARWAVLEHVI